MFGAHRAAPRRYSGLSSSELLLEFAVEREIGGRERVCELVEATGARNHWGRRAAAGAPSRLLPQHV